MSVDIVCCPQDGCIGHATVQPLYYTMNPAGGIIVHQRITCVEGHITFTEQDGPGAKEVPPSTAG
jgi:hypothetical protein